MMSDTRYPLNRTELILMLRKQAREIAEEEIPGWGNTMSSAADMLAADHEAVAKAREKIVAAKKHLEMVAPDATRYSPLYKLINEALALLGEDS